MNDTGGQRRYNDADMLRLQQEAEDRVLEMHQRAKRTMENANASIAASRGGTQQQGNRNWNPGPNTQRRNRNPSSSSQGSANQNHPEQTSGRPEPAQNSSRQNPGHPDHTPSGQSQSHKPESNVHTNQDSGGPDRPSTPPGQKPKEKTLIQGILDGIGIDDDRLTIIGLILILLNQKADYTLILALGYLLF